MKLAKKLYDIDYKLIVKPEYKMHVSQLIILKNLKIKYLL
jgi:hypothetical protein